MKADWNRLEFDSIRRALARECATPYGRDSAQALEPAPTPAAARALQAAISAVRRAQEAGQAPVLGEVPDVRAALRQAGAEGAVVNGMALRNLVTLLDTGRYLRRQIDQYPELYVGDPGDLTAAEGLGEAIEAVVDGSGRVRDGASQTLANLEAEVRDKQAEVEAALGKVAASRKVREAVVEPERSHYSGPRRVLALKADAADRLKGVRREALDGGKGILVEPMEVVPANNRLEQLGRQIDQEQRRLLRELTDGVRERGDALQRLLDAVAWVDLAIAGGRLSREMDAAAPELTDRPELVLHRACHPALVTEAKNGGPAAVPFDLELGPKDPMILITGPNTGGKTVVVKTAGLLAVMAHCGLHIPAAEGSRVGAYHRIVVDIGDPQSLANHVSTFAGHVEALKGILAEADERTLVLLDELGTGTDPEEGAALAMAVLEELAGRGVQAVLTTHLSPLKTFATDHDRIRNANMRFDHDRLAPTYQLEVGRPGASLGLVVAEQGGLEAGVLERARGHLQRLRPEGEEEWGGAGG